MQIRHRLDYNAIIAPKTAELTPEFLECTRVFWLGAWRRRATFETFTADLSKYLQKEAIWSVNEHQKRSLLCTWVAYTSVSIHSSFKHRSYLTMGTLLWGVHPRPHAPDDRGRSWADSDVRLWWSRPIGRPSPQTKFRDCQMLHIGVIADWSPANRKIEGAGIKQLRSVPIDHPSLKQLWYWPSEPTDQGSGAAYWSYSWLKPSQ